MEKEFGEINREAIEKICSGEARLIDMTSYVTDRYIKCKGDQIETIGGRLRIAFARCPKCNNYLFVYRDEIYEDGKPRVTKKCLCGFRGKVELKDFNK